MEPRTMATRAPQLRASTTRALSQHAQSLSFMMAYQQRFKLRGEATLRRTTRFRRVDRPAGVLPRTSHNMMATPAAKQKKRPERGPEKSVAMALAERQFSFARQRSDFVELYRENENYHRQLSNRASDHRKTIIKSRFRAYPRQGSTKKGPRAKNYGSGRMIQKI